MRLVRAALALAIVLGSAQACSLFIPFDEYPGPGTTSGPKDDGGSDGEAGPLLDPDADAGADAPDDGDAEPDHCFGIDKKSDPLNCGACDRRCANDGGCDAGRCPIELVVDAGSVVDELFVSRPTDGGTNPLLYWGDNSGTLGRHFIVENTDERAPDASVQGPIGLNGGGGFGFYVRGTAIDTFRGATFASTSPTSFVTNRAGLGPIAVVGQLTFWGDNAGLMWRDIRGNGIDAGIFGSDASPPAVAITYADDTLYWAANDGTIWQMAALAPQFPAPLTTTPLSGVTAIAALKKTSTYLYLCQTSQALRIYTVTGGVVNPVNNPLSLEDCEGIAVTADAVYAINLGRSDINPRNRGELWRTNVDGTGPVLLASNLTTSSAIVVSGEWVYFTNGKAIWRTTK